MAKPLAEMKEGHVRAADRLMSAAAKQALHIYTPSREEDASLTAHGTHHCERVREFS
eukprot:CAMPEP_0119415372 /NCGR_PEP_ID=MMETSP1335-20130426/8951_1 /TAXON_ID=259385 /ORGANISM="Chrysoculter rhomboideus, Strain RCC1486" /LENGTH=56 /DNA_ID=CAMNT_0007440365 /DNA_START=31 /DNA_END=198 /DNA_ORIENTATION=+